MARETTRRSLELQVSSSKKLRQAATQKITKGHYVYTSVCKRMGMEALKVGFRELRGKLASSFASSLRAASPEHPGNLRDPGQLLLAACVFSGCARVHPDVSERRGFDARSGIFCTRANRSNNPPVDRSLYEEYEESARSASFLVTLKDWLAAATALLLDFPIWTDDQGFFWNRYHDLEHRPGRALSSETTENL
jgi:PIN domain